MRKVAPVYGMVLPLNIGSKQVLECVGYAFTKYYLITVYLSPVLLFQLFITRLTASDFAFGD